MDREKVWAEEFKSYVAELQLFRDDYKGIIEYIDEGLALLKEQDAVKIEVKKINGSGRCGRCPNCLMELNEMDYPYYCGFCGKAVKWE